MERMAGVLVLWLLTGCSQCEAPAGDWGAGRGKSWFGNWVVGLCVHKGQVSTQVSVCPPALALFTHGRQASHGLGWV